MAYQKKSLLDYRNGRWVIKFDYNPVLVDRARLVPGGKYNGATREWDFPDELAIFSILVKDFMPLTFTEAGEKRRQDYELPNVLKKRNEITLAAEKASREAKKFPFKRKPFCHQIVAFDWLKDRDSGALFMEMGTGKSTVIVNVLSRHIMEGRVRKVLVAAPGSTVENFAREIELNSPFETIPTSIIGYRYNKDKMMSRIYSEDPRLRWFITNYESIGTYYQHFLRAGIDAIICDESTAIKNHTADRTKFLMELGKSVKYKYILTGTPITQNLADLFSQFKFLDENILGPFITRFRAKYLVEDQFHRVVAYNNADELLESTAKHSFVIRKDECLDLPPKIFNTRYFDLSPEYQKMYNDMKNKLLVEIESQEITAQIAIKKIIKLSQISSGFINDDDGNTHVIKGKNVKLELLEELLDQMLPHNSVVVWCRFHKEIEMVAGLLQKLKIPYTTLTGMDRMTDRLEHIDKFQNKEAKVIIGTPGAGGKGVNLTTSCNVIYFSNDYKLEDRLQSQDRVHRIGQMGDRVNYFDLVARDTIDQEVLEILSAKKTVLGVIMNQGIRGVLK